MRDSFATKIISIAMMMLTPAAMLMAETSNTMLYAKGSVLLNGVDVARSAPVSPGDRIETAGSSAVTIDQSGSKVTVNPYSSIGYATDGLKVFRGGANIETTDGMAAKVSQITVTPVDKNATYEVARLNNKVTITSHSGALLIADAGATSTLTAGGSSTLDADPTPTPAPAPQAAPNMIGSDVSHQKLIAIGAVVGGIAVACGLWCGMSAASVPPGGFGNGSAQTANGQNMHMGRRLATIVSSPAIRTIATVAANGRSTRTPVARNTVARRATTINH